MDYEKKYNEALEKARQLCAYPTTKPFISDLQDLFPELKESEDEKIRKEIVGFLDMFLGTHITPTATPKQLKGWLAWIEKQGKPNPFTGTGFKYNGHEYGMCARDGGVEITIDGNIADRVFPKDRKPMWTEEDEVMSNSCCHAVIYSDCYTPDDKQEIVDWIKSLKQRIQKGE